MRTRRSKHLPDEDEAEGKTEEHGTIGGTETIGSTNASPATREKSDHTDSPPSITTSGPRRATRRKNSSPVTPQDVTPMPTATVATNRNRRASPRIEGANTSRTKESSEKTDYPTIEKSEVSEVPKQSARKGSPDSVQSTVPSVGGKASDDPMESEIALLYCDEADTLASASETSPPPPLKVIHTSLRTTEFTTDRVRETKIGSGSSGPKYLDETTLNLVKAYLKNTKGDLLDEDEVVEISMRLTRIANQRARYHTSLAVTGRTPAKAGGDVSDDGSEIGSDDTSIYDECLEEEEEQSMGHDLLRKVITAVEGNPNKSISTIHGSGGTGSKMSPATGCKLLDKKTLTWIKRAAGLHRSDIRNIIKNHEKGAGSRPPSRFTRKQAKDSRHKKRERGLDILGEAVTELEVDYGPFPVRMGRKTAREKKKSRRAQEADSEEEHASDLRHKRKADRFPSENDDPKRRKKETGRDKEVRLVVRSNEAYIHFFGSLMLLVCPSNEQTLHRRDSGSSRAPKHKLLLRPASKPKARVSEKRVVKLPQICTSLRKLDWLWRDRTRQFENPREEMETPSAYRARKSIPLHPQFKAAGIVHRLPRMHTFARHYDKPKDMPARVYDPPRRRHTDQQYAEICSRLMNCLQGHARLFVTCEFFYSDLDREW
jgi:hypothetical protein